MEQKTILFDLDGTLTDSGPGIMNCAELALKHFHLPIPDRAFMREFVGPPLHDTFVKFGVPADRTDEAIAVYRSRYTTVGLYENTPYPGIEDLLQTLKAQGHQLLVATSKPEGMAVKILTHFNLASYFSEICGASLDHSRSTKEDVIAYLLTRCEKGRSMLMVGDTAFDVVGAAAHGIPAIGVAWGYGKVADMVVAGAKAIAHDPEELLALLNA